MERKASLRYLVLVEWLGDCQVADVEVAAERVKRRKRRMSGIENEGHGRQEVSKVMLVDVETKTVVDVNLVIAVANGRWLSAGNDAIWRAESIVERGSRQSARNRHAS